jgi:RNA polymerase sigma-70 factor (ECF subfamily)
MIDPQDCPNLARHPAQSMAEARDTALLGAVAFRGDGAAFEQLYRLHVRAVTGAAYAICRDIWTAEDIAQRTFATLWERAGRLAAKSVRLRPWLVTVARNAAIDHLRAAQPYTELTPEADALCPQEAAVTQALIADLAPALATLSSEQRTVIELRYFAGLTFPAIAERTGERLETVKSRARLALAHLRRLLG